MQTACNVQFNTMIGLFEPGSPDTTSSVLTPGAQLEIRKITRLSETNMSLRFTYGVSFELKGNRFGIENISVYFSGDTAPSSHTLLANKYEFALQTCFKGALELKYNPERQ